MRIADNKTSDFSIWDNKLLLDELEFLKDFDLYTGFDYTEAEDFNLLDDGKSSIMTESTDGVYYEVVFKSEDKGKIDRIKQMWEDLEHEEDTDRGDIGEEAGDV